MEIDTLKISGIPETMLYTFYMKYLESVKQGGIINDPGYREIISRISFDFNGFSPYPAESPLLFSCRSLCFDREVKDFISRHPSATFVSFGSGIDFRFERVDNGTVKWFDVDLPEVIEIRRKICNECDRLKFIPASALDFSWAQAIGSYTEIFFLAEGLFIYFTADELRELILFILSRYPDSMLMFDSYSSYYRSLMKGSSHYPYLNRMQSMWRLDLNDFYEIAKISPGIIPVREYDQCEMYGENAPGSLNEVMASDLPANGKEQIMNMVKIYLMNLNLSRVRKDENTPDTDILYETICGIQ